MNPSRQKPGSPRPGAPKRSDVFPGASSAAAAIGVPTEWLRDARAAGCPGFPASGRVEVLPILRWALERLHASPASAGTAQPVSLSDAKRDLAVAQAQAQRIKTAERLGNLISRERHEALVRSALEAGLRFISEIPVRFASACNPAAPDVAARVLADAVEQTKARFRNEP